MPSSVQTVSPQESPFQGLSIRDVAKQFGPIEVLTAIDMDVAPGEVVALLGENGAGKSTLASIIAGVVQPTRGAMVWNGEPYAPAFPGQALEKGIGLIQQEIRLLPDLTIAENMFVGRLRLKGGWLDRAEMNRLAAVQLERLGLNVPPTTLVRRLSVSAQQQVEIAKALTMNARLLIFDEPTAALGEEETDRLFVQIERLKKEGVGFIYVSHRLEEIARIADKIVVLRDGRLIAAHETGKVPVKTLVAEMVGRNVERLFPEKGEPHQREVLAVKGLTSKHGAFRDVSFSVRAGEVFGIAGIVGAGRTELARAIMGADPVSAGTIEIDGKPARINSPSEALAAGMVMVPEDRKQQGLVLQHTLANNIAYGNFDRIAPSGWVGPRKVRELAEQGIARMRIRGTANQLAGRLSGGNQQKTLIARWISRDPKIFILDEPTRGIDVGSRAEIYNVVAGLAASGMAVVVVSSDLEEIIGISHRVMVLSRGRQRAILTGGDINHETIMELATT
ncbi:MAG TPA: sugar ABC transporter ATP-binding protein [Rhizobiaceae bacterium]|nr:sugar ABC transporter ATP-binding protein [Rhizobiaceae bacterium]